MCTGIEEVVGTLVAAIGAALEASASVAPELGLAALALEGGSLAAACLGSPDLAHFLGIAGDLLGAGAGIGGITNAAVDLGLTGAVGAAASSAAAGAADVAGGLTLAATTTLEDFTNAFHLISGIASLGLQMSGDKKAAEAGEVFGLFSGFGGSALAMAASGVSALATAQAGIGLYAGAGALGLAASGDLKWAGRAALGAGFAEVGVGFLPSAPDNNMAGSGRAPSSEGSAGVGAETAASSRSVTSEQLDALANGTWATRATSAGADLKSPWLLASAGDTFPVGPPPPLPDEVFEGLDTAKGASPVGDGYRYTLPGFAADGSRGLFVFTWTNSDDDSFGWHTSFEPAPVGFTAVAKAAIGAPVDIYDQVTGGGDLPALPASAPAPSAPDAPLKLGLDQAIDASGVARSPAAPGAWPGSAIPRTPLFPTPDAVSVQVADGASPDPGSNGTDSWLNIPTRIVPLWTGPGTADPFGLTPYGRVFDYTQRPRASLQAEFGPGAAPLLDQLGLPHSEKDRTLLFPGLEPGIRRDADVLLHPENYRYLSLRPRAPGPSPRAQAAAHFGVLASGIVAGVAAPAVSLVGRIAETGIELLSFEPGDAIANAFIDGAGDGSFGLRPDFELAPVASEAPGVGLTERAIGLRGELVDAGVLNPTRSLRVPVAVTQSNVAGAPRVITVGDMAAYEAIANGRVPLGPGEILGPPPEFGPDGLLLPESHVEGLGARFAAEEYGATGGHIGTVPKQCEFCAKLMDGSGWVHTNPR